MQDAQSELDAYHEVCAYTLTHGDPAFIHQHVVDAFAVQHADEQTKPIALTFGLIGLFLKIARGFTGREVQRAHMALGREKHVWPTFVLPRDRGALTARDVVTAPPGPARDRAIDAWCASVWNAFAINRDQIARLLEEHHIGGAR
jgi:uncharacterized protein DUF5946